MDSPGNDTTTNTNATTANTTTTTTSTAAPSDSVANQDSAIFSYINDLSPLKPEKVAHVAPGFPRLGSPPMVFTSPRLNPLRETSFLKRPLSNTELSELDVREKKVFSTGSNAFEKSKTRCCSALVPFIEKECDKKDTVHGKVASPSGSGCIDKYFADAVGVDYANSTHSSNLSSIQSDYMSQSLNDCTDLKEMIPKLGYKNDVGQDNEKELDAFPATLELDGKDFQGKSSLDNKSVEINEKQGGSEMPPSACSRVEPGLSVNLAFEEKRYELLVAQHAGTEHKEELDYASQFLPESLQPFQRYEDFGESNAEASNKPVEERALHDPKSQQHYGMHRRCLRFEDAQCNTIANSHGFWSPNTEYDSSFPASSANSQVFESSCPEVTAISSGRQLINLTKPIISTKSAGNSGNLGSTASKPSGIGLHLNSIIQAMPLDCVAIGSSKPAEHCYVNVEGVNLVSTMDCHQTENAKNNSMFFNVRERVSASSQDGIQETQDSVATCSLAFQSPQIVKPSNDLPLLNRFGYQEIPCDKRKGITDYADFAEELNQSNPKKKRKKPSAKYDGDGCKHCNCKKTKCLKLYCDCFAAGIYCDETCTCLGCFNRPEYEDTVLETRQQIESRNPLAFASKIVQRITDSPANSNGEDGNNSTPSSARHKRGCNCKKSMCLKKYCECYQATVGCSDGCRCEGCKNVYGRKEDSVNYYQKVFYPEYGTAKEVLTKGPIHESFKSTFDEELETVARHDGLLQSELFNPHNITPLTPPFQFSNHEKNASKSHFSTRRCLASPESNLPFLLPYGQSLRSPQNSDNHVMLLEERKHVEDISCQQELDYSNAEKLDEFSPRYDGLGNASDISPLPNPPSTVMASSVSSKLNEWTTISRSQSYSGGHLSSVSSLCWRSSPITPVSQFSGTKLLQAVDSDKKLHDILEDDDTPEILKESSTPLNAVKVCSPNKKRVSPPHSSLQEHGSSSSAG